MIKKLKTVLDAARYMTELSLDLARLVVEGELEKRRKKKLK